MKTREIGKKAIQKVRTHCIEFLWKIGLFPIVHHPKEDVILMYHGIDEGSSSQFNYRFVGFEDFEKQLVYFKKKYHIISLGDFFEEKFKSGKPNIAITFDDGYENWLTLALPIIERQKTPVTFFVTSLYESQSDILWADLVDIFTQYYSDEFKIGELEFTKNTKANIFYCEKLQKSLKELLKESDKDFIIKTSALLKKLIKPEAMTDNLMYWKLLSPDQILEIEKSDYVQIGSHSRFHTSLGKIAFSDAVDELDHSKRYLESIMKRQINTLAFPSGSYSRELVDEVEKLGFKQQLVVDYLYPEDQDDNRIRSRIGIYTHVGFGEQLIELR